MQHRGCRSWYIVNFFPWEVSRIKCRGINRSEPYGISVVGANLPFDEVPDKRTCNCHRDLTVCLGSRSVIPGEGAATEHLNPLATSETDRRAGTSVG